MKKKMSSASKKIYLSLPRGQACNVLCSFVVNLRIQPMNYSNYPNRAAMSSSLFNLTTFLEEALLHLPLTSHLPHIFTASWDEIQDWPNSPPVCPYGTTMWWQLQQNGIFQLFPILRGSSWPLFYTTAFDVMLKKKSMD